MEIFNGTYCVYVHTNKINGKMYVGQTCQKPEYRWGNGKNYEECPYFYNAINKYGWDAFDHEIIAANLTKSEADNLEKLLIKQFNTMDPDVGYNLKEGGTNGTFSEVSRKKMSESQTGKRLGENHPMYGKSHSEDARAKISNNLRKNWDDSEFRVKMSEVRQRLWEDEEYRQKQIAARTGKKRSDETRQKLSNAMMGEKNPMYGKCVSDETKQKMSESHKKARKNSRRVNQYTIDGIFVKTWDYLAQITNELTINSSDIRRCCQLQRKSAGGFAWRYADEDGV